MSKSLLDNLLAFYEEEPNDPFNAYALALEYTKFDVERASYFFEILLHQFPDYLPTYYHAAAFYFSLEKMELTENIYQKGIGLALQQANTKTHTELTRAYRAFLDELEC